MTKIIPVNALIFFIFLVLGAALFGTTFFINVAGSSVLIAKQLFINKQSSALCGIINKQGKPKN